MKMENLENIEEKRGVNEPLLASSPKIGFKTLPFILGIDGIEKAASQGIQASMIVYLMGSYGLDMTSGSNILFWWSASASFAPIFAAFLADAYIGRFRMIAFGSFFSLLGMTVLWSTTMIPRARPSCKNVSMPTNTCSSPTPIQLIILCSSFALMSIGTGGIRSSTIAFGADQLVINQQDLENKSPKTTHNNRGFLVGSLINWFFISTNVAVMFALTFLVYVQDRVGWELGFGLPLLLMFISTICFFSASYFYVQVKPKSSLLTGFARVLVASWRNRHFEFPNMQSVEMLYYVAPGSTHKSPSEKLRFLNKACVIKDPSQDLTPEGTPMDPWDLCTTDQVEEMKSILSLIPLWSTGILMAMVSFQSSFQVVQASAMDRHFLSSSFEIPAGSFSIFAFIVALIWLVVYDRVMIPLASNLSIKTRMGVGFVLTIMAMVVAAIVESVRRDKAIKGENLSAMWLVPQICLLGLAQAIGGIAQVELFYLELPRSMSSIATNLGGIGLGLASVVASLIMSLIDRISKRGGQPSWVSGDVDQGHYDYYYWVLAVISLFNYLYFLLCSRAYWPGKRGSYHKEEAEDE